MAKGKKADCIWGVILIVVMALFALFVWKGYTKFFTLQGIEGEQFLQAKMSPNGKYEVRSYRNNGGATSDFSVLVVLIDLGDKSQKNIFWDYPCQEADMEWKSNEIIKINNISLHIPNETYDFRTKR